MVKFRNLISKTPHPNKDRQAKWDAIQKKLKDAMGDKFDKVVKNYDTIREIKGTKLMRELHLKK